MTAKLKMRNENRGNWAKSAWLILKRPCRKMRRGPAALSRRLSWPSRRRQRCSVCKVRRRAVWKPCAKAYVSSRRAWRLVRRNLRRFCKKKVLRTRRSLRVYWQRRKKSAKRRSGSISIARRCRLIRSSWLKQRRTPLAKRGRMKRLCSSRCKRRRGWWLICRRRAICYKRG